MILILMIYNKTHEITKNSIPVPVLYEPDASVTDKYCARQLVSVWC